MKLKQRIKEKSFLAIIIAVAIMLIFCIVLFMSGFFQENENYENKEVENMTLEDLPEEVQKEIENLKFPPRNFSISKYEIESKNKQIIVYVFNIRDEGEVNSLQSLQVGEWSFKFIHDIGYEEEMDMAAEYFEEMKKNHPELEIAGFGISSKELEMWVYNRTTENQALDGKDILNRTIHVYVCSTPPPKEKR